MGILNYSCQKFYWVILSRSFLKMLRHVYSARGAHFCNCWSLKMAPQLWFSLSSIKVMLDGQRMKFPLRQGWGGLTLWHLTQNDVTLFSLQNRNVLVHQIGNLAKRRGFSCSYMSQVYIGLALLLLALWKVLFEQNSKSCHSSST